MSMSFDDSAFDDLDRRARALAQQAREEVRRSAEDMAALARAQAPVLTGAVAGSIRVEHGEAASTVIAGEGDAYHAVFLNKGTVNMDAVPFFTSAEEAIRPAFEERMAAILDEATR